MEKTLIVTDDAMIIREMIKDAARSAGWEIKGEATNGQEAIDLYQEHRPLAATLDLVMPEYDGLHALRGIMETDPNARVLVISALDQKDVLAQALELGATDFIVKPFKCERVVSALEKVAATAVCTA